MKRKKDKNPLTPLLTGFDKIDPAKPAKKPIPKFDNPLLSKHTKRLSLVGDEDLYPTTPNNEDMDFGDEV